MRRAGATLLLGLVLLTTGCIGSFSGDDPEADNTEMDASKPLGPGGLVNTSTLSQPVHGLASVTESFIPSHDGTELHAAEYHPNVTADTKTPVVIQLSPYFGNLNSEAQALENAYWTQFLVQRGYTVVHASVRGTGYSGGCFQLGGPTEIQDAHDLVEHYHEQDWSNGNVALIGVSYPGTTPWQAAITDPDGLATVVPMEGISDMYRYDHVNGASYTHGPAFPTYYTATSDWLLLPQNADGPNYVLPAAEAACPGVAERMANGWETLPSGDHDAFWDERNYEAHLENITVPVFLVAGFQDWNVDPDNGVPIFDQLPNGSKAWIGQWAHNYPFANTYNSNWDRHDWNLTLTAWFDEHLKNKTTGIMDEPAVLAQTSRGQWHRTDTWPPTQAQTQRLYLTPDGLEDSPGEAATLAMGPWNPGNAGGVNLPAEEQAPQNLTFTSAPLNETTVITGRPTITLNVSIDRPDGHLVADLYDPDAAGNNSAPQWLGHAILNLAHRDSRDNGETMPMNQPEPVTLTFFPMDAEIPAGHRLMIELKPEDTGWIHPSPYEPTYTVHLGGDQPASFAYPVLEDPAFEPAPEEGEILWST